MEWNLWTEIEPFTQIACKHIYVHYVSLYLDRVFFYLKNAIKTQFVFYSFQSELVCAFCLARIASILADGGLWGTGGGCRACLDPLLAVYIEFDLWQQRWTIMQSNKTASPFINHV